MTCILRSVSEAWHGHCEKAGTEGDTSMADRRAGIIWRRRPSARPIRIQDSLPEKSADSAAAVEYARLLVRETSDEIGRADSKAALLLAGGGVLVGTGTSV